MYFFNTHFRAFLLLACFARVNKVKIACRKHACNADIPAACTVCYLLSRSQHVKVDKALSLPLDIASGVPSRVNIGAPALYIVHKLNDLPSCICFSQVLLYADDTVLFFAAKTAIELEARLNTDINRIYSWMPENKLFLNVSKTEYVTYGSPAQRLKREDSISLSCDGSSLRKSESFNLNILAS